MTKGKSVLSKIYVVYLKKNVTFRIFCHFNLNGNTIINKGTIYTFSRVI